MVLFPLSMVDAIIDDLTESWADAPYYALKAGTIFFGPGKGIKAARGAAIVGKIEGFTVHGLNQAITRGVKPASILDAVKNPLKVKDIVTDTLGRQSQRYIGREAEVVLNPKTGKVISVNPTSSSKAARLLGVE